MSTNRLALLGGQPAADARLKVKWPIVTDADKKAVMKVLDEGPLWALGADDGLYAPEMNTLEKEFAAFVGTTHALACCGGTAALHMAVAAAGVAPGDEVVTSAYSFVATPVSILHNGGVPIFADIDPRTYNIDVADMERKITPRTKALIPVHVHGVPADMDAINAIAKKHNLVVIEDACQAPGSTYKGRPCGSLAHMAAFSLNGTKNFAAGEGGLFATSDDTYRARANMMRMVGEGLPAWDRTMEFQHLVAWNYRFQEMPAAFARSQLKRLPAYNAQAQTNGRALAAGLAGLKGIAPPYVPADCTSVYHKFRVRLTPDELGIPLRGKAFRDVVQAALEAEGVDAYVWLAAPLPAHPIFQVRDGFGHGYPWTLHHPNLKYRVEDYPQAQALVDNSLCICSELHPIYAQPASLIDQYAHAITKVFSQPAAIMDAARKLGRAN
jgi:dTDP-4-amino-4,6-dideoxygalactose transaminase